MKIRTTKYSIYYKETKHDEQHTIIYHMLYETFSNFEFIYQLNSLLYNKVNKIVRVEAFDVYVEPNEPILTYRELKKEVCTND